MASLNIDGYRAALKQLYPKDKIENLTFQNNPLYAMMQKDPDAGGENWKIPVHYEDIPGRAADFQKAQANKGISRKVAFLMTPVRDYALASIDGLVWKSSLGNRKAFLAANKSELDSAFNAMRRSAGISVYRSGTGSIANIDSTVTGTTLTLASPRDINNFGRGFKIVFSGTDGGVLRGGGTALTVTHIDRSAGTMTMSANLNTVAGLTAGDFIYVDGDAANGGANIRVAGMSSWLPITAPPAGDSHFGVDRSVDVVRLAGNRIDAAGMSIEDAFIRGITEIAEQGGSPDKIFCPYNTWERLGKELGGRKEYTDTESAGFYFRGIKMYSPEGEVNIYADRNCPIGRAYAVTMKDWTFASVGPAIDILDLDTVGTYLREATADAYELRVGGYQQVQCCAPGHSGVIHNLPE